MELKTIFSEDAFKFPIDTPYRNINKAPKGTRVKYLYSNENPAYIEMVNKYLIKNNIYSIKSVDVGSSSARITLLEFPTISFNASIFETFEYFETTEEWINIFLRNYGFEEIPTENNNIKQVIVLRTHYPNINGGTKKIRLGKYIAQACHGSIAFLTNKLIESYNLELTDEENIWVKNKFTKICLGVETEEELLNIHNEAKKANLTSYLITDSGLTEFHGEPTNTCVAIGPHKSSKIDYITGSLKLL